jgi:uncharacterized protein (TIGR00251 family)
LAIKVIPSASRDEVAGWLGDALKVRVAAPPERGKANAAVVRVIAAALGVRAECVRVVSGAASPRKIVEISGLAEAEVRARLSASAEG